MARTVSDLALMLDAMAHCRRTIRCRGRVPAGGYQAAMRRGRPPRRIGFSANLGLRSVDPEVAAICQAAAQRFADMGCEVDEARRISPAAIDSFQVLRALLFADVRGDLLPRTRSASTPTSSGTSRRVRR